MAKPKQPETEAEAFAELSAAIGDLAEATREHLAELRALREAVTDLHCEVQWRNNQDRPEWSAA